MPKYARRSTDEKHEMLVEIANCAGVGIENGVTILQLIEHLRANRFDLDESTGIVSFGTASGSKPPQNNAIAVSSASKTKKDPLGAIKKTVDRMALSLQGGEVVDDDEYEGFLKLSRPGKNTLYFWTDEDSKQFYLEKFTLTKPRAIALHFVEQHLKEMLPSHFVKQLQPDFEAAQKVMQENKFEIGEIIEFSPYGFQVSPVVSSDKEAIDEKINIALKAIIGKDVLSIRTESIHNEFSDTDLMLSPYKLKYLNHRLKLFAYEHKKKVFKHYDFRHMKEIKVLPFERYIKLEAEAYEQQYVFRAKCHSWVKAQLENLQFGEQAHFTKVTEDVWEVTDTVTFPMHFAHENQDSFFIANFLSMFSDSIEVIEPEFLRREMKRRSEALVDIYKGQCEISINKIIQQSPHNMANLNR
jgi:predicted DNA-binding transcriptional regulator YafY